MRRPRAWMMFAVMLSVPAACALVTLAWYEPLVPKRFAPVVEGRLYRSGRVEPEQLRHLVEAHQIKSVICLLNAEAPETVAERAEAERLGLDWHNIPLPGDGASTPEERARIRALLAEIGDRATLVHCSAGTNRTGLAIGMYRLHHDGWPLERVMRELRTFDFEDEPHHENLREALRSEAALAAAKRTSKPETSRPIADDRTP